MTSTEEVIKKSRARKSVTTAKTASKRSAATRARKTATKKSPAAKKTASKKTTVKKTAVKKAATKKTPAKKTTARRDTKTTTKAQAVTETVHTTRKAPTAFSARAREAVRKRKQLIIVGCLLLLGVGSSAVVGFTDEGRIDINQKIVERNERLKANTGTADDLAGGSRTVPVQNTNTAPDGGLIGLTPTPKAPRIPASTTASSTASTTLALASSTASSTEAVSGEDNPQTAQVAGVASSSSKTPEAIRPEEMVADVSASTSDPASAG